MGPLGGCRVRLEGRPAGHRTDLGRDARLPVGVAAYVRPALGSVAPSHCGAAGSRRKATASRTNSVTFDTVRAIYFRCGEALRVGADLASPSAAPLGVVGVTSGSLSSTASFLTP